MALWTLEFCIRMALLRLTLRLVLVAAILTVPRAITLPVLADAAFLVLALKRLRTASFAAVPFILPLGAVPVPVTHPAKVDTPAIATCEGGVRTAGSQRGSSPFVAWAVSLVGAVPAVIMAVTPPLWQDTVCGVRAVHQVRGPVLGHQAIGDKPPAVAGGTSHLVTGIRAVWHGVTHKGVVDAGATETLELSSLVSALAAHLV